MGTAKKSTGRVTPRKTVAPVTSAADWKRSSSIGDPIPLTVPSGKTCLIKRPLGLHVFLKRGMIPNSLLEVVQTAMAGKKSEVSDLTEKVIGNTDQINDMFGLVDDVTIEMVVEPLISPIPVVTEENSAYFGVLAGLIVGEEIPPHLRDDDDTLYVDYVEDQDKFFIFNYAVGGTNDVETFRERQAENVAALASVGEVEDIT